MLGVTIIAFQSKIYVVGFFYSLNSRASLSKAENMTLDTSPVRVPLRKVWTGADDKVAFSRTQAATIVVEQETEMSVMVSLAARDCH